MADPVNDKKVFSLLDVTRSIRKTIAERYQSAFWVKAEMNKLNHYAYSGHCYPELVEKNKGKVVAQMSATLWRDDYMRINENFIKILKEPLKDGITVLFSASISFDPVHGISLRIIDIDPIFVLGELEREKLETIALLKRDGIFDSNRKLTIPLLPKKIAVISVETSKGYSDFINVLNNNVWGYNFFCFLFPALLQGDRSVDSIVAQLARVKSVQKHFDVVVIIRGGGGDVGLSSYNNHKLAAAIAKFPIPVLTGIGHSTNETVSELVAFKNAITPTELADYLIQKLHDFSIPLERACELVLERSRRLIDEEKLHFRNTIRNFRTATTNSLSAKVQRIQSIGKTIAQSSFFMMKRSDDMHKNILRRIERASVGLTVSQRSMLTGIEKTIAVMDPVHVLRRGFTITSANGKVVTSTDAISVGDELVTTTAEGKITSTVTGKNELTQ